MNVDVREATELDLDRILFLYRDSGLDDQRGLTLEEAHRFFERIMSYPRYRLYVAEVDSQIVGTFALLIMDNLANGGMPSGVVEDVAVAREAQGRGVGKRMMRFALDQCRRHGCYKMLFSSNAMRAKAHGFYEALGFTRHGYSYRVELETTADRNGAFRSEAGRGGGRLE
jgi:GNAT superfamily N-acetyltransferase